MITGIIMITTGKKQKLIKKTQAHDTDTGSTGVQVAILSERIKELSDHLKTHKKDIHSRRGLIKMVDTRRKHLKYLKRKDPKKYEEILKTFKLKK